jgi:hypothetical protein
MLLFRVAVGIAVVRMLVSLSSGDVSVRDIAWPTVLIALLVGSAYRPELLLGGNRQPLFESAVRDARFVVLVAFGAGALVALQGGPAVPAFGVGGGAGVLGYVVAYFVVGPRSRRGWVGRLTASADRFMAPPPRLSANESLMFSGGTALDASGTSSIGGALYVTSDRICFVPSRLEAWLKREAWEKPLGEIISCKDASPADVPLALASLPGFHELRFVGDDRRLVRCHDSTKLPQAIRDARRARRVAES